MYVITTETQLRYVGVIVWSQVRFFIDVWLLKLATLSLGTACQPCVIIWGSHCLPPLWTFCCILYQLRSMCVLCLQYVCVFEWVRGDT